MINYSDDLKHAVYGNQLFTKDKKTNYYLSTKKVDTRRKRLHVFVWETHNGIIPKGYHVHHRDGNKFNNDITNLTLLPIHEHLSYHFSSERSKETSRKNIKLAIAKAPEWHKSDEGKEWHKAHYEKTKDKLHILIKGNCLYCGKEFEAIPHTKFCSNSCKSAWRRQLGLDNVKRTCAFCGQEFITNKYSSKKYCNNTCRYNGKQSKN